MKIFLINTINDISNRRAISFALVLISNLALHDSTHLKQNRHQPLLTSNIINSVSKVLVAIINIIKTLSAFLANREFLRVLS